LLVSATVLVMLLIDRTAVFGLVPVTLVRSRSASGNRFGDDAPSAPFHPNRTEADTHNFQKSYNRLEEGLAAFPGVSTEDVLKAALEVAPEYASGCTITFHNGQAALQFGKQRSRLALAYSLSQCADAVDTLRYQISAAQKRSEREQAY
jgi:hypothetical protein